MIGVVTVFVSCTQLIASFCNDFFLYQLDSVLLLPHVVNISDVFRVLILRFPHPYAYTDYKEII